MFYILVLVIKIILGEKSQRWVYYSFLIKIKTIKHYPKHRVREKFINISDLFSVFTLTRLNVFKRYKKCIK